MKMVKTLPEFEYFTVFLNNRNFFTKMRISKVTDCAALRMYQIKYIACAFTSIGLVSTLLEKIGFDTFSM